MHVRKIDICVQSSIVETERSRVMSGYHTMPIKEFHLLSTGKARALIALLAVGAFLLYYFA